jgi:hypothetical protein
LPYKNCIKFELVLDFESRRPGAPVRDGRHSIVVSGESRGWDNASWEGVPETSRKPNGDGTRSFEHGRDGEIPVSAPPTIVAHEFGHLFGLGDDRAKGKAKPGRDGTLMVGGIPGADPNQPALIDQDLINRIGDVILKHLENQKKKIPECESWTGSLSMSLSLAGLCEGSADGEVHVSVVDDAVTATFSESGSLSCDVPGADFAASNPFQLTGTFKDDEFVFTEISALSGEGVLSGVVCFVEPPVVVGVNSPGSASAEWTNAYPGGGTVSCQMTLERDEEEPAVG